MNKAAILLSAVVGVVGCGNSSKTNSAQSADTQETCITIQRGSGGTVADTFIKSNVLRHNFGSRPHLRVSRRDEALLRFDISPVPAGVTITRASLKLFVNGERGEGTTEVHRVLAPWDESTVTYQTFKQAFARDIVGAFVVESRNTVKTVDLTSLVASWAGGAPNNGILLRPGPDHPGTGAECDEDNDPTIYVSSEGHNIARRPALEICYQAVEVDPCADNPCQNGGACTAQGDGYTCQCAAGYTGTNCETNINECASNPCQNGGTCTDGIGSYTCACTPGFSGANCETDINDCDPDPCQNGGVCQDGVNSYTCTCPNGYDGTNCEHLIDNCAASPCHNGGTCINGVGSYTCQCAAGFEGENCDINTDDCIDNECQNGATCIDGIESYTCACAPDWGGEFCEVNLNTCAQQPCLNGAACTNTFGSYFCTCADGYAGVNCEIDIDDCTPNPCLNGGTCVDGVASFTCHCAAGFSGVDCGIPDPAIGLTGSELSRGGGFEISGANFRTATASVYVDNILGCVVMVQPDGTFHTTSCFSDTNGAFRNFPEGAHTLTVSDGAGFTIYAQVTFVGTSLTVDGVVEQSQPFMMNANNVEGTATTDWWIAGRHTPVQAWGRAFQQSVRLADLELGLLGDGSKNVSVRTRLSDGSVEQLVGAFQSVEPSITLDPASGAPGSTVHVTGQGFASNVTVGFGDNPAGGVSVDASGHFDTTLTVPVTNGGGRGGPYAGTSQVVSAVGSTGHQTLRVAARFDITGASNGSSITATAVTLPYWGTVLNVTGTGFSPPSPFPVGITIGLDATTVATSSTLADGSFTAVVVVPPDNLVSHSPWVLNATESPKVHRASLVLPAARPTVSLSTNSAVTGDVVIATVTNTNPATTNLRLYIDDVLVSSAVVAGVPVPIALTRQLNLRPGALHMVSVVDMTMGSGSGLTQAAAPLTIVAPSVVAGAASNADGTQITVDGASFAPGQSVSVSIDNQSLGTAQVSADGSLSLTSTLASLPAAVHTVLVTSDDGIEKASASIATH